MKHKHTHSIELLPLNFVCVCSRRKQQDDFEPEKSHLTSCGTLQHKECGNLLYKENLEDHDESVVSSEEKGKYNNYAGISIIIIM